jgi:hypothetical protein
MYLAAEACERGAVLADGVHDKLLRVMPDLSSASVSGPAARPLSDVLRMPAPAPAGVM